MPWTERVEFTVGVLVVGFIGWGAVMGLCQLRRPRLNYIDKLAERIHVEAHGTAEIAEIDRPLYRLYALLCLVQGEHVRSREVHDAWAVWIVGRPDYDPDRPPTPWRLLPLSEMRKDDPYRDAIVRVAQRVRAVPA